jgi:hypothetical protein
LCGWGCIAIFALSAEAYSNLDVKWAVARLSALFLLAALVLFMSVTVWNYSNVLLGRAGTLEDLMLALRLIGKAPTVGTEYKLLSEPLSDDEAKRLQVIVKSMEGLRRTFEKDLLQPPSVEWVGKSGKGPS